MPEEQTRITRVEARIASDALALVKPLRLFLPIATALKALDRPDR